MHIVRIHTVRVYTYIIIIVYAHTTIYQLNVYKFCNKYNILNNISTVCTL